MENKNIIQFISEFKVTLRLVRRLRGSTVVEVAPPRGQIKHVDTNILPLDALDVSPYAKLFSATKQQVCGFVALTYTFFQG